MCPHSNDLNNSLLRKNLVDVSVLNVYPPGVRASQIADQLLIRRFCLMGIVFENLDESFGFGLEPRCRQFLGIFLSLFCENNGPLHQGSSGEHFPTDVFSPRRIDARILGIESKYRVSWIARQSSSERRTPLLFLPKMWTGSWDFSDSARSSERLARAADTVFMISLLLSSMHKIPVSVNTFNDPAFE